MALIGCHVIRHFDITNLHVVAIEEFRICRHIFHFAQLFLSHHRAVLGEKWFGMDMRGFDTFLKHSRRTATYKIAFHVIHVDVGLIREAEVAQIHIQARRIASGEVHIPIIQVLKRFL